MEKPNLLLNFVLQIADNNLILGHRLSECCGHGPVLEQDIAITNIALDLIGQARSLYQYAAKIEGKENTEDHFAYFRDVWDFKNVLLVEQPNGDFAHIIVRQFFFDVFHKALMNDLADGNDQYLSGYAQKSLKEIKYHFRYSSEWMVRLGDGTDESHERMQNAVNDLWPYLEGVFAASETDRAMEKLGLLRNMEALKVQCISEIRSVMAEATLDIPKSNWQQSGGKIGKHSEHLGYILADMQYLQRAYPGNEW